MKPITRRLPAPALNCVARSTSAPRPAHLPEVGTHGASLRGVLAFAERLAGCDLPVHVCGETGVEHKAVAQHIHAHSRRAPGPFVAESFACMADARAEALLCGSAAGAFHGTDPAQSGLFDRADGGTLFLDELGDMPLSVQARLLHVLEERRVRPVGSPASHAVDVRVVCASTRELGELVRAGRLRAELFSVLDGATLRIPPLRERPEDVLRISESLLDELNASQGTQRRFARSLVARLAAHPWNGNVRELRHRVAALYHVSDGDEIDGEPREADFAHSSADLDARLVTRVAPLAEIESEAIQLALSRTRGDRREAARLLGISRSTIYAHLRDAAR